MGGTVEGRRSRHSQHSKKVGGGGGGGHCPTLYQTIEVYAILHIFRSALEQCWVCVVCWSLSYAVKSYCCWTWQIWVVFYTRCGEVSWRTGTFQICTHAKALQNSCSVQVDTGRLCHTRCGRSVPLQNLVYTWFSHVAGAQFRHLWSHDQTSEPKKNNYFLFSFKQWQQSW